MAPVLELHVGGRRIETTAEHPFYVFGEGWVRAQELQPGDGLLGLDDAVTVVDDVAKTERTATVYNLRVADDHTYFVGARDWGFSIWVHNAYIVRPATDGSGTLEVFDDVSNQVVKSGFGSPDEANTFIKSLPVRTSVPVHRPRAKLPENEAQLRHIFRDAPGHVPDTPANRQLLQSVADDATATLGTDRFGNVWSARINSDGTQTWVQSRNGVIINGGVNQTPRTFNPRTGLSSPVGPR